MKTAYWCIGKTHDKYLAEGIGFYVKRISNYLPFEYKEILVSAKNNHLPELQKQTEKEAMMKLLKPNDYLILLDDKGSQFTSDKFAEYIQKKLNTVGERIIFLSGGAYGFPDEIYERANAQLSLSPMTFTHQMIRLLFTEQFYRAMSILRNEPYHH